MHKLPYILLKAVKGLITNEAKHIKSKIQFNIISITFTYTTNIIFSQNWSSDMVIQQ